MNKDMAMEMLIQRWLVAPKPERLPERPAVRPAFLFRYENGYRIGRVNRLIRVARAL